MKQNGPFSVVTTAIGGEQKLVTKTAAVVHFNTELEYGAGIHECFRDVHISLQLHLSEKSLLRKSLPQTSSNLHYNELHHLFVCPVSHLRGPKCHNLDPHPALFPPHTQGPPCPRQPLCGCIKW